MAVCCRLILRVAIESFSIIKVTFDALKAFIGAKIMKHCVVYKVSIRYDKILSGERREVFAKRSSVLRHGNSKRKNNYIVTVPR